MHARLRWSRSVNNAQMASTCADSWFEALGLILETVSFVDRKYLNAGFVRSVFTVGAEAYGSKRLPKMECSAALLLRYTISRRRCYGSMRALWSIRFPLFEVPRRLHPCLLDCPLACSPPFPWLTANSQQALTGRKQQLYPASTSILTPGIGQASRDLLS